MLVLEQSRHGIKFKTVWYATERIKGTGIIHYRQAEIQNEKEQAVFTTLISDLTVPEEEVIQQFSKNCRYYANRAPKEGVTCFMKSGREVTEEVLEDFIKFFTEFWQSKNVEFDEKRQDDLRKELNQYREAEALSISGATLEGSIVVYHTYVEDGTHVRLLHSASLYRTEDSFKSNIMGMANRYLHKQDMLTFKQMGIKVYDWGGAGKAEDVKHITEFKESFGGASHDYYNFDEIKGIWSRLFMMIAKVLGR